MSVPLIQTIPPHLRSGDSLAKRYWPKALALIPVLILAGVLGGMDFLRILFLTLMCVMGFDWLGAGFFRKRSELLNGETVLTALLLALLLPAHCPTVLIVLAAFMSVIVAGVCFGGLGSRVLNAAVFGRVFLDLGFPWAVNDPVIFFYAGHPWMLGAIILSGIFFLLQKQYYLEVPVLFTGIFLVAAALFGQVGALPAALGIGVFSGCFLLTDLETLPLTRRGSSLFSMGAAFFAVLLALHLSVTAAVGYAILTMNCMTPWLNVWNKPRARTAEEIV